MNPMEFLRYLALSGGDVGGGASLSTAIEAAHALSYVADEAELVMACRRLLAAHPHSGRLWTLAATMCGAAEPLAAARKWIDDAERDRTHDHAAGDATLVTAHLVGPTEAVVADSCERYHDGQLLLVAPFGTAVPADVTAVATTVAQPRRTGATLVPLTVFDGIVGPAGLVGIAERGSDCVTAAELLRGVEADVHKSRRVGR